MMDNHKEYAELLKEMYEACDRQLKHIETCEKSYLNWTAMKSEIGSIIGRFIRNRI